MVAALPLMLLVLLQPCCQVWIEGVQLVCPTRAKQTPQVAEKSREKNEKVNWMHIVN